jgi:hypothetical protein
MWYSQSLSNGTGSDISIPLLGISSDPATLEEGVTLRNGQTSSSVAGRYLRDSGARFSLLFPESRDRPPAPRNVKIRTIPCAGCPSIRARLSYPVKGFIFFTNRLLDSLSQPTSLCPALRKRARRPRTTERTSAIIMAQKTPAIPRA